MGTGVTGPAWSIWPPFFLPLPSSCALLEIKCMFSSKMNGREREKEKPPRVEKWQLLAADFLPLPRRQLSVSSAHPCPARLYANEKLFPCLPI